MHIEFLDTGNGKGTYIMRSTNLFGMNSDGTPGKPGDPGKYEIMKFGLGVPGQGGLVDTPDGRWFYLAQGPVNNPEGRVPHLLPVTWTNDWPVPGVDIKDGKGNMAWHLPKPIAGQKISLPAQSDDFSTDKLSSMWAWNHQPRADHWSLTERPGFLRLHSFPPARPGFFGAGNTIYQRSVRSEKTVVTVKLDLGGMADGQEAGLAHFNGGTNCASLGVVQQNGKRAFIYTEDGKATKGAPLPPDAKGLWIRCTFAFDAVNHYSVSFDEKKFVSIGGDYKLKWGNWRGDMVGIYTFNPARDAGFIDVDSFLLGVSRSSNATD